jgi:hypothetical protein
MLPYAPKGTEESTPPPPGCSVHRSNVGWTRGHEVSQARLSPALLSPGLLLFPLLSPLAWPADNLGSWQLLNLCWRIQASSGGHSGKNSYGPLPQMLHPMPSVPWLLCQGQSFLAASEPCSTCLLYCTKHNSPSQWVSLGLFLQPRLVLH